MKLNKLFLSVFIAVSFLSIALYVGRQSHSTNDNEVTSLLAPAQNQSDAVVVTTVPAESKIDYFPLQNSVNQEQLVQEIEARQKNDVLGVERESSDYANYSDEILTGLASSGDVIAMKMLALRYQQQIRNIEDDKYPAFREKLNSLYNKAIVYGDREFLGFMPGLTESQRRISDPRLTAEQKHQAAIDLLAHTEFMGLRGALKQKYTNQIQAYDIYPEFGFPLTITEADKQLVREKAQEIYKQYEKQRLELGLGPFDNSVPEELSKVYEYERRVYELKMGNNAI